MCFVLSLLLRAALFIPFIHTVLNYEQFFVCEVTGVGSVVTVFRKTLKKTEEAFHKHEQEVCTLFWIACYHPCCWGRVVGLQNVFCPRKTRMLGLGLWLLKKWPAVILWPVLGGSMWNEYPWFFILLDLPFANLMLVLLRCSCRMYVCVDMLLFVFLLLGCQFGRWFEESGKVCAAIWRGSRRGKSKPGPGPAVDGISGELHSLLFQPM